MVVTRIPGVVDAGFSYEEGSGWVTYRPDETKPEEFIERLMDMTGYTAKVVREEEGAHGA